MPGDCEDAEMVYGLQSSYPHAFHDKDGSFLDKDVAEVTQNFWMSTQAPGCKGGGYARHGALARVDFRTENDCEDAMNTVGCNVPRSCKNACVEMDQEPSSHHSWIDDGYVDNVDNHTVDRHNVFHEDGAEATEFSNKIVGDAGGLLLNPQVLQQVEARDVLQHGPVVETSLAFDREEMKFSNENHESSSSSQVWLLLVQLEGEQAEPPEGECIYEGLDCAWNYECAVYDYQKKNEQQQTVVVVVVVLLFVALKAQTAVVRVGT